MQRFPSVITVISCIGLVAAKNAKTAETSQRIPSAPIATAGTQFLEDEKQHWPAPYSKARQNDGAQKLRKTPLGS